MTTSTSAGWCIDDTWNKTALRVARWEAMAPETHTAEELRDAAPLFTAAVTTPLDRSEGAFQALAAFGWTPDDLREMEQTWRAAAAHSTSGGQVRHLLIDAAHLSEAGATPREALGWLQCLYRLDPATGLLSSDTPLHNASLDWRMRAEKRGRSAPNFAGDFVAAYRKAAKGNRRAALLAAAAGLGLRETARHAAAGRLDETVLQAMVGLRRVAVA